MVGYSSGLGDPHLMLILVPYSNFSFCLCLKVCLHLGTREYHSLCPRGHLPTMETKTPKPLALPLGY